MLPRHTRGNRPVPGPCRNGPRLCRSGSFSYLPRVAVIDCLYVVHRPVDVFGGILSGVGYACQVVGDERFYSASAGAGECQYRAQEAVVEQLSFQLFRFPTGIKMVYVHHNQARRSGQAVAFAVGKDTAGGNVGQCLLLEHTIDFFIPVFRCPAHGLGQCFQAFAGCDQFVHFL